jgi:hypothetical protein
MTSTVKKDSFTVYVSFALEKIPREPCNMENPSLKWPTTLSSENMKKTREAAASLLLWLNMIAEHHHDHFKQYGSQGHAERKSHGIFWFC